MEIESSIFNVRGNKKLHDSDLTLQSNAFQCVFKFLKMHIILFTSFQFMTKEERLWS